MESHALQHHWTAAFITEYHIKDNKENKGWEKKRKTTIPTPRPAGKGEGSRVSQYFGQHSPALPLPISNIALIGNSGGYSFEQYQYFRG